MYYNITTSLSYYLWLYTQYIQRPDTIILNRCVLLYCFSLRVHLQLRNPVSKGRQARPRIYIYTTRCCYCRAAVCIRAVHEPVMPHYYPDAHSMCITLQDWFYIYYARIYTLIYLVWHRSSSLFIYIIPFSKLDINRYVSMHIYLTKAAWLWWVLNVFCDALSPWKFDWF